MIDLIVATVD